jgi:NAD(P)-dependent dehydrogenase (short-subunit alcohol dehydrogenase family)
MLIDLSGRKAVITGASQGLGRAMAARFSASGADVALVSRDAGRLDAAVEGMRAEARGALLAVPCDITDEGARAEALARIEDRFGAVDILVNNAGSSRRGPVEEQDRAAMIGDLDLKLLAPLALIQAVVPGMKARRWGRILNITAIVGKTPDGGSLPTSVSRGAGITMTKALSKELAPWNILVNTLCVGKIKSGQWERRHAAQGAGQSYEEFLAPTAATVPLGRMGEAEEFAAVACFLASNAASYVTGTAINVDGGLCAVT